MLTATRQVDGWRERQWVALPLEPGQDVAVQQGLLVLDQRLQSAPEGVTLDLVDRLLNHWNDIRTAEEKANRFDDWAEDLEEFSEAHLAAACKTWRQNNSFPPKIADIRALCLNERARDQMLHRRSRVLLGLERPLAQEVLPARDAAQLIELKPAQQKLLAEAVVGQVVGTKKRGALP